ncbi:MAG: polysaccharide deacetylase family protein, partial [Epsilonproteobacteria bacterium]|nr:polysaccharide deacetylase family protein [Campylobacterota bacterium]
SNKVYFFKSAALKNMYLKYNMDYEGYQTRVNYFKDLCSKNGYGVGDVDIATLANLKKNDKLILLDAMSLSADEIEVIDLFVAKGGRVLFNFRSGFLDSSFEYRNENLVRKITGLTLDEKINTIKNDPNNKGYVSVKLLSPMAKYLQEGEALEFVIYDPLPIFNTKNVEMIDTYLTTWGQNNYVKVNKNLELTQAQSGLIWHGNKEKGKWVYFSFPSYVFVDGNKAAYAKLFRGMLEYLERDISAMVYPYIDAKNIVFVSEDTEYKFENLKQFYDVSLKNKIPVTAFCVANLAKEHKELMAEVARSDYMEIGSHSFTHNKIVGESDEVYENETIGSKKLLDKLTAQEIKGFRPPREEIDAKMIQLLQDGGFKYILSAGEKRLSPYFNEDILIIPRHGTDDYSYLINLDWNSSQVLNQMEKEVGVVTSLDGIYTMSTHTHLMTYSTNISIVDNFFKYVNSQPKMSAMNGHMIYERILQKSKISLNTKETAKKLIMTLNNSNDTEVKNLKVELYIGTDVVLKDVESEIIGVNTELLKVADGRYTLTIDSLKPQSQMVFFVNYDKAL